MRQIDRARRGELFFPEKLGARDFIRIGGLTNWKFCTVGKIVTESWCRAALLQLIVRDRDCKNGGGVSGGANARDEAIDE